jgi:2'-hydroxyisoflavone reductase
MAYEKWKNSSVGAKFERYNMKLLILGGTVFLGRHIVNEALQRDFEVTMFNRGKNNPNLFPECETIIGNRDSDLSALKHRTWDAVIDTCGYVPRIVEKSAKMLADNVEHYTFISTVSAYQDFKKIGITEDYPLAKLSEETTEKVDNETYGGLKALCEQKVIEYFPNRNLIIRPGLIVGPFDPSDRFTYWIMRLNKGGKVLLPKPIDFPVQFIDARDLAAFTLNNVEKKKNGIFNAVGPEMTATFEELISEIQTICQKKCKFIKADEKFLLDNEVTPFLDLPLWLPQTEDFIGLEQINGEKAIQAGMQFRPMRQTIEDTLAWITTKSEPLKVGLSTEREEELIAKWKNEG